MSKINEKKNSLDWHLLKRVLATALPYKHLFLFCIILPILLAPVATIRPYIVKVMVDNHILKEDLDGLGFMAMLFIGAVILDAILRYIFIYTTALLGQSVIKDMRVKVFNHITNLKLKYFDKTAIGTATTRTISDIEAINNVFAQGVITIFGDLLIVVAVICVMFYTSWILTVISLVTLPLLIIATYVFKEKVKSTFQVVRSQISMMNAFLQERITGMNVVQIFNAEKREARKFREINRAYTKANLDSVFYYAVFFPVVELITTISLALMIWLGSRAYLQDYVSFGSLVAFPLFLNLLFRPVRMLADKFNTLQMGLVAAERVFEVLDNKSSIENKGTIVAQDIKGKVEFDDVSFSYDDENFVLNNVSFTLNPGETLAIVGSTGSGKSTIINILNRFYEIQSGMIKVDGVNAKDYTLDSLRNSVSMVLQDVFLFNGTVLNNITLRDESITRDKVIAASKQIGAHVFIEALPDGYDFKVTERGSNLSVGQRQLISFVRALVFDPSILILDEATASIDTETEAIIQVAIEKLIAKRSSIIIAHRLSTIRHTDNIMVLDKGNIVELGPHEELMKIKDGKYRQLYDMQFSEEEAA